MTDRFGPVPVLVNRLVLAATLRYYASYALFERIIMQRKITNIILPKGEKEDYYKHQFVELMRYILDEHKETIKFEQKKDVMRLQIENTFESPEKLLEFLIEISSSINELFRNTEE
jgi:transcription-repair coupling factor (superfamily II helicase)